MSVQFATQRLDKSSEGRVVTVPRTIEVVHGNYFAHKRRFCRTTGVPLA